MQHHRASLALLVLSWFRAGGGDAAQAQPAPTRCVLPVTLHEQIGGKWCWAATGSLVLDWLEQGSGPSQCMVAARSHPGLDCKHPDCDDLAGAWTGACDKSGVPDFAELGWQHFETKPGSALSWQELQCEINAGRPVAFGWWYSEKLESGSGHMMAVAGYGEFLDGSAVAVADSLGPQARLLAYDYWIASESHWHGQDWYGFHPATSPPPKECAASSGTSSAMPRLYASPEAASQEVPLELAAASNDWLRKFLELPSNSPASEASCLDQPVAHALATLSSGASQNGIRIGPFLIQPLRRWTYPCFIGSSPFDLVVREGKQTEWLEIRGLRAAQAHERARSALAGTPAPELVEFVLPALHVSMLLRRGPEAAQVVVPVEGVPGILEAGKPLKIGELVEILAASPFAAELGLVPAPP